MKKSAAIAFMLFSLVTVAQSEIKLNGSLEFFMDQTMEMDGEKWYSMNGDVFGTGDWKQSTNDNWNDNRNKFQAILNLNSEIKVNDKVKLNIGFETMYDELIGKVNGSGTTAVQEFASVRDNQPLILKDITAEINSDFAKFTLTNSFNYDFNNRVLAMQLEDSWGEPMPYGEGILMEKDLNDIKTKTFMFQASKDDTLNQGALLVNSQNSTEQGNNSDKIILGTDLRTNFSKGKVGLLAILEHDKSSVVQGDNFKKELDIARIAVNGEIDLTSKLSFKGEFITAQYGKDVKDVINTFGVLTHWVDTSSYTLGSKKNTSVIDLQANYNMTDNLQIAMGYKSVGEDYTAVLGNSQRMDSWLGDASFDFEKGLGYEEGINTKITYTLPTNLLIKTSLEAKNNDLVRSAIGANEDTNEQEIKGMAQIIEDKWKVEASYRQRLLKNNGTGTVAKTDLAFDDLNANGELVVFDNGNLKAKVNGDLNYYVGQDYVAKKNFSTETRVKVGANVNYKFSDKLNLKGTYSFGHATEDNDIIKKESEKNHFRLNFFGIIFPL